MSKRKRYSTKMVSTAQQFDDKEGGNMNYLC